jgi:predicted Zn-dependent peptidase
MKPARHRIGSHGLDRLLKKLGFLFALLSTQAPLHAQIAPGGLTSPPSPTNLPAFVLPTVLRWNLPNGLHVAFVPDHRQPALWVDLAVPAGSVYDPAEKVGLAEMTVRLLDKGTQHRTASQIAQQIDRLGATFSTTVGRDCLFLSLQGLSDNARPLFDLLSDMALHPQFPPSEVAKERTQIINEIASDLSDASTLATAALDRLVYGAHPYGDYPKGTPETLRAISPADLKQFHQTHFVPNDSTLFIVGDLSAALAHKLAQTYFGNWPPESQQAAEMPLAPHSYSPSAFLVIHRPNAAQTAISIGVLTAGYAAPDRIAADVAAGVLGGGEFNSRLNRAIREERGLAYYAYCRITRHRYAGSLEAVTLTKTASTGEVVHLALDLIRQIGQQPIPVKELTASQRYMVGSFFLRSATPRGFLTALEPALLYGQGPRELADYASHVQAITPQQAQQAMARLPLSHPIVVLVGNAPAIVPQLRSLGTVEVIPEDKVDLLSPTLQSAPSGATSASHTDEEALFQEVWQAHGGDALKSLQTLQLKGKGSFSPPGLATNNPLPISSFSFTFLAPDRMRMDLQTDFGLVSIGVPGGDAAAWFSLGVPQDAPAIVVQIASTTNLLHLLLAAKEGKETVHAVPDLKTDAGTLPGFALTSPQGQTVQLYIDPQTHLVQRIVAPGTGDNPTITATLKNYHSVNGVQLPQQIMVTQDKATLMQLDITDTQANVKVDDTIFAKPKTASTP